MSKHERTYFHAHNNTILLLVLTKNIDYVGVFLVCYSKHWNMNATKVWIHDEFIGEFPKINPNFNEVFDIKRALDNC